MARATVFQEIRPGAGFKIGDFVWGGYGTVERLVTDSTIAPPPKNSDFILTNVSWLLDTRKDAMKQMSSRIFLVAKYYQTMPSRWQWAPYFRK